MLHVLHPVAAVAPETPMVQPLPASMVIWVIRAVRLPGVSVGAGGSSLPAACVMLVQALPVPRAATHLFGGVACTVCRRLLRLHRTWHVPDRMISCGRPRRCWAWCLAVCAATPATCRRPRRWTWSPPAATPTSSTCALLGARRQLTTQRSITTHRNDVGNRTGKGEFRGPCVDPRQHLHHRPALRLVHTDAAHRRRCRRFRMLAIHAPSHCIVTLIGRSMIMHASMSLNQLEAVALPTP